MIIYELPSILERLDLSKLFQKPQPLEVELGAGDGSFLAEYAIKHPEHNFIGVERLLGRLRKIEKKGSRARLQNLRGIRIESSYFLEYLLPAGSVTAFHIYFPDPWPKKKHRHHRLINERFAEISHRALAPGGTIYLRTDHADYFEQMLTVFSNSAAFQHFETPAEMSSILTDFERDFQARGIPSLRAAFRAR